MSKMQSIHAPQTQKATAKRPEKMQKPPVKKAQMLEAPETMRPDELRAAQQELGNQVVQRALDKSDRRAGTLDEQGNLRPEISNQIQQKRGGGSPLPDKVQQEAARKLGHKFNEVRIHTDESADKLSRSIHARAFTIGKDIFFKNGTFAPASTAGRETILHELTHVVQQGGGKYSTNSKLKLGAPDSAHEKEADQVGKKYASAVSAGTAHGGTVQADTDPRGDRSEDEEEEGDGIIYGQPDHAVVQAVEEEEPLQGQPDHGMVQAVEEEEPLQGQPDHGVVQAVEEEEPLQGQPDHGVVQAVEEEEPLQGQPDHGMVQAQAENVVQKDDDEEKPGVPKAPPMSPKMQKESVLQGAQEMHSPKQAPGLGKKLSTNFTKAKQSLETEITGVNPNSLKGKLKAQKGKLKEVKNQGIEDIEKKRAAKFKEAQSFSDSPTKEGKLARVPSKAEKKVTSREKLMSTISNASSKPEDVKAAQEKLNLLHKRSFGEKFKGLFSKKKGASKEYGEQAQMLRKKNLMTAAQGGDEKAFNELKGMEAEKSKNSTWGKIKGAVGGLAGKLGGLIGGQVKSMATDKFKEAKAHYMGPDKKEEEDGKESKKGEKGDSGKSSSNANAGIGAMMEKYGELVKENMSLKQKIAELEKAK